MRYQLSNELAHWNPFAQLFKEFDEDFQSRNSLASPRMEWQENEKAYLLSFDIPGMKQEDIKIDLKDNTLTISAERKQSSEKREKGNFQSEKFYGMYRRSLALPVDVSTEEVQADYNDGVLEIYIPKSERAQAKSISIGKEGKLSDRFLASQSNKQ